MVESERWVDRARVRIAGDRFPIHKECKITQPTYERTIPSAASMSVQRIIEFSKVDVESARDGRRRYGLSKYAAATSPSRLLFPSCCLARHIRIRAHAPTKSQRAHTTGSAGTIEKKERNKGDWTEDLRSHHRSQLATHMPENASSIRIDIMLI